MALPDVSMQFSDGNLPPPPAITDNVFAVIGPSSLGKINTAIAITDPNTIAELIGYGPLSEAVAQILANTSTLVYAVPGLKAAGSVGAVSESRPAAPNLTVTSLVGIPGAPMMAASANTGNGTVAFDDSSEAILSSDASYISVIVTTRGALGTAQATINIGSTQYTSVTLTVAPVEKDSGADSTVVFDFTTPLGGAFEVGDTFTAVATPNDAYSVLATIDSISDEGVALWTISLDGGVTVSSPIAAQLGCTIVTAGSTAPDLTIGGTAPAAAHDVVITCTQQGTALGVAAQCSTASGLLTRTGSGLATATISTAITAASGRTTAVTDILLTITDTGTAAGSATSGSPGTGTGTGGGTLLIAGTTYTFTAGTLPATFTHTPTGIVFALSSSPGNFTSGDTYVMTAVQAPAVFTYSVDGVTTTGRYINSSGQPSNSTGTQQAPNVPGVANPTLVFAATNTDIYTYSSGTPSNTTSYTFSLYPSYSYQPTERDGSLVGLNLAFGFGAYEEDDAYAFTCTAPSVVSTDAMNALDALLATDGVSFSMVHLVTTPDNFDDAATVASAVQTTFATQAQAPTWRFLSALVYGPDLRADASGGTPADFVDATSDLALDRVAMSCGADYVTSALTQRRDLRNAGFLHGARLAAIPVSQDPGAVADGPLVNGYSTTTTNAQATQFNDNRGMCSRTFSGRAGIFANKGVTLAGVNSDYHEVTNRRVIDKCAALGRQALLPYVNGKVRTVPGTGTINLVDASNLNADVQSKILNGAAGDVQSLSVEASTTANVLSTETLPVTISARPFAYVRTIRVTIGFTV